MVRLGLLIVERQPAGGVGVRNRLNGELDLIAVGSVGPRSPAHATVASLERHDRMSSRNISTSEPHWNLRYSGSPAHDVSCSRPVSRTGYDSRNAFRPAA